MHDEPKYLIMGIYQGNKEEIDSADTITECNQLINEYQLAFGSDWKFKRKINPEWNQ